MQTTPLSDIIARMDRWKTINDIDEPSKVKDIDTAIKVYKRKYNFPWQLRKSSLRVFPGVLEYLPAPDHNVLAFVENSDVNSDFNKTFRGVYTTIRQFIENPDDRNDLCEIWKDGEKILGVRSDTLGGETLIDDASDSDKYSYSGDIVALSEDSVLFKTGNSSIRFEIVNSSDTSTVTIFPTSISDSEYKKKYLFVDVYLENLPTSITMKFGNDASNYLYKDITAQFSGEAFKVNQWNTIAIDLNTASLVGTIDYNSFSYVSLVFSDLETGYLYIDASYLRGWSLKDYWYYSKNVVKSSTAQYPDKQYFVNNEAYDATDGVIGDTEFADLIMFEAMLVGINEKENAAIFSQIQGLRDDAWLAIVERYPSLEPTIQETYYRFV